MSASRGASPGNFVAPANPWDTDPVAPAPSATAAPWDADPVVPGQAELTATPTTLLDRIGTNFTYGMNHSFLGSAERFLASRLAPDSVPFDPNTNQPMPGPTPRQQVLQGQQEQDALYNEEPAATTTAGKIVGGVSEMAGSSVDPTSLVGGPEGFAAVRAGEHFLPALVKSAGVQAGVNAASDAASQGLNIADSTQQNYDPMETVEAAGTGAAIGALGPVLGKAVNQFRDVVPHGAPRAWGGTPLFAEDVAHAIARDPVVSAGTTPADNDIIAPPAAPVAEAATASPGPQNPAASETATVSATAPAQPIPVEAHIRGSETAGTGAVPVGPWDKDPITPTTQEPNTNVQPTQTPPSQPQVAPVETAGVVSASPTPTDNVISAPTLVSEPEPVAPQAPPNEKSPVPQPVGAETSPVPAVSEAPVPGPAEATPPSQAVLGEGPGESSAPVVSPVDAGEVAAGATPIDQSIAPHDTTEPVDRSALQTSDAATTAPAPPVEPRAAEQPAFADKTNNTSNGDFNTGTSPHRQIFSDAGYNPDVVSSLPQAAQNRIMADQIKNEFGFRDVKLDPKQNPKEVGNQLANFYQSGREMTAAIGAPRKAISLDGKAAFEMKPFQKNAKVLGSYRPADKTITIPGRSNSFAHEYSHLMDHHLQEQLSANPKAMAMLSRETVKDGGAVANAPNSPAEAFANVVKAVYGKDAPTAAEALKLQYDERGRDPAKAQMASLRLHEIESQFAQDAKAQGGPRGYLADPAELLARSHEAFVSDAIRKNGGDTAGVAKPEYEGGHFDKLYPQGDDQARIFHAYRDLHAQLREHSLLAKGEPSARPDGTDTMDPALWHRMADTNREPGLTAALKREVTAHKNFRQKLLSNAGFEKDAADPGHLTVGTRSLDMAAHIFATGRTVGNRLAKRQPTKEARAAFQKIMDHLTPAEHLRDAEHAKDREIGPVFEEAVREHARGNINQLTNILHAHGLESMAPQEKMMLRHVLTEGNDHFPADEKGNITTPIPKNISSAAGKIRFLLDREWQRDQDAGLDVGYAKSGYYPRQYNDHKIFGDPKGFQAQATKLHKLMFEQDVKGAPEKLLEAHDRLGADVRDTLPSDTRQSVQSLRKNLSDQDKLTAQIEPKPANVAALQAKLDTLKGDATDLHDAIHDPLRDAYATEAAHNWFNRINVGDPADFETRGPSASFTNKRVLPPEADRIMAHYMTTDPTQVLPAYFHQSARKVAFAQRFGVGGAKLDKLLQQASDGGARGEDIAAMRRLVETVTGKQKSGNAPPVDQAMNTVHALGSMALMPRAMWSSLGEPMAMQIRTGNMKATMHTFASQIGDIVSHLGVGAEGSRQRTEIANALGITMSHLNDSIISDRVNSQYSDAPRLSKLMTNYYRRTGLTGLTNSQRRSAMSGGHIAMGAWAKDLLNGNERQAHEAAAQFRDMGIPDSNHVPFASWMQDHKALPSLHDLETPQGKVWGSAITRLTDKVIADPMKIDKPLLSQSPLGRLGFGLMSFSYAYYHNTVEHFLHTHGAQIGEGYKAKGVAGTAAPLARAAAHGTVAVAGTILASLIASTVRERLFNSDQWNKHEREGDLGSWLTGLAISRTGLNGPMDAVAQLFSGLRYQTDISGLMAGAQGHWLLGNLGSMAKPFTGAGSPNTNTTDYNAVKGAWNLMGVPAIAALMSALPGGPVVGAGAGAAMQYLTGQGFSDNVATAAVGPKGSGLGGTPPPGTDEDGNPIVDPNAAPPPAANNGTVDGIPIGLLDDFIGPVSKIAGPVLGKIPFAGQAALAAGAAGLAAKSAVDDFSKWKKQ